MEIVFPDIPEYHFILKGLYSNQFPSYPRFRCEPVTDFETTLKADVAFVPAPVAILNSGDYLFLKTGNIFSYFSGPQIYSNELTGNELFVNEKDFVSEYYAKILLNGVSVRRGDGYPKIVEPRIALLNYQPGLPKIDLYGKWNNFADNLPFPLYSAMIKRPLSNLKGIVEEAIHSSIKYALDNSPWIIKDIATMCGIENVEMLKRVMFQFINKNTLSISEEEVESLKALEQEMGNKGYRVSSLKF